MSRSSFHRSKRRQLGEEVEKLGELIARLPLPLLQKRLSCRLVPDLSLSELISAVDSGLWNLRRHAELGNVDAIAFLRDCGCSIAEFLCELTDEAGKKLPLSEDAESILQDDLEIEDLDRNIQEAVERLKGYGCDDLEAVSRSLHRVGYHGCFEGIEGLLGKDVSVGNKLESQCLNHEFDDFANDIVNSLISFRMNRHVSGLVRDLASNSLRWPYWLDAVWEARRDSIEMYVGELALGGDLPFRMGSLKERSRSRGSWHGSVTQFALELMVELERHRLYEGVIDDDDERWIKLAVSLPPFSHGDGDVVDLWFDAGMALLECRCQGKWKEYPWPKCIFPKRATRLRTERERVAAALKKGTRNLIKRLP